MKRPDVVSSVFLLTSFLSLNHALVIPLSPRSELGDVVGSFDHPIGGFDHPTGEGPEDGPGWTEHGNSEDPNTADGQQGHVNTQSSGGSEDIVVNNVKAKYQPATDSAEITVKEDPNGGCGPAKARRDIVHSRQGLGSCLLELFKTKQVPEVEAFNKAGTTYKQASKNLKQTQAEFANELIVSKLTYIDNSLPQGITTVKLFKNGEAPEPASPPDSGKPRTDEPETPISANSPESGIPIKSPLTGTSPSTAIFRHLTGRQLIDLYVRNILKAQGNMEKVLNIQASWSYFLDVDPVAAVKAKTDINLDNPSDEVEQFVNPPRDPTLAPKADDIVQADKQAYSATLPAKLDSFINLFDTTAQIDATEAGKAFESAWKEFVQANGDLNIKSAAAEAKLEKGADLPPGTLAGVTKEIVIKHSTGQGTSAYKQSGFTFQISDEGFKVIRYPISIPEKIALGTFAGVVIGGDPDLQGR